MTPPGAAPDRSAHESAVADRAVFDRTGAARRNGLTAAVLAALGIGMVGAAFAAVPFYQWFCKTTGFGGTTQVATAAPTTISDRAFEVSFDANVDTALPWRFQPVEGKVTVRAGEVATVHYRVENLTGQTIRATAAFNVSPDQAGAYFNKIACFCFTEQRLAPHETLTLPVTFFVDPSIVDERGMKDINTLTLSYTFFELPPDAAGPRS
jgi:cytochrome c oxidase assembly protein subunit 11